MNDYITRSKYSHRDRKIQELETQFEKVLTAARELLKQCETEFIVLNAALGLGHNHLGPSQIQFLEKYVWVKDVKS